eukprot:8198518-Karenia_brevis.AAC.1
MPSQERLMLGVNEFIDKVKWRWHFRRQAENNLDSTWFHRIKPKTRTKFYNGDLVPPELDWYCLHLRSAIFEKYKRIKVAAIGNNNYNTCSRL